MLNLENYLNYFKESLKKWSLAHILGVFLFNLLIVMLLLLKSAGYFSPYLPLTINILFFISLILMVILLNIGSRGLFLISIIFLLLALVLKVLYIDIWSERSALYAYEALNVAVGLFFIESIVKKSD